MRQLVIMLSLIAAVCTGPFLLPTFAASQWEFDASILVPAPNTLFLAVDSRGNIYATSFNSRQSEAEVVAMKIANPAQEKPKITIFDRLIAPAQRGYAGIACDSADNVYISFDAGENTPSFIRKFLPSLEPDTHFGNNSVLATRELRVLGLTAHKDRILAAVSWGRFLEIDSKGNFLGVTPQPSVTAYIRDIAFVPNRNLVYGVDRDGLWVFLGGSLDHLDRYMLEEVIAPKNIPKAGSAISFNKLTNELFYTDRLAGGLAIYPLDGSSRGVLLMAPDGHGAFEPADSVASTDGRYLYVSDLRASQIVRYRYAGPAKARDLPSPTPTLPVQVPAPSSLGPWLTDIDQAFALAQREKKIVVAFFHSPLAPRSAEVAENVLTPEFLKKFPEVIWVRLDSSVAPQALTRFGVYKVPSIVTFDATGKERQRLVGQVTQGQVASFIEQSK
ncbi:MAG: hypothetical protein ACPL7D_02095 [Candidatus Sumerlaeaceae bacterium]|jgi:hypothetical protein